MVGLSVEIIIVIFLCLHLCLWIILHQTWSLLAHTSSQIVSKIYFLSIPPPPCWNSHKLLRYCHAYIIVAYRTISLSYASLIRLPTCSYKQTKYTLLLLHLVLSS